VATVGKFYSRNKTEDRVISLTASAVTVGMRHRLHQFGSRSSWCNFWWRPAGYNCSITRESGRGDRSLFSLTANRVVRLTPRSGMTSVIYAPDDLLRTDPQKVVLDGEIIGTTPPSMSNVGGLTIFCTWMRLRLPIEKLAGLPDSNNWFPSQLGLRKKIKYSSQPTLSNQSMILEIGYPLVRFTPGIN